MRVRIDCSRDANRADGIAILAAIGLVAAFFTAAVLDGALVVALLALLIRASSRVEKRARRRWSMGRLANHAVLLWAAWRCATLGAGVEFLAGVIALVWLEDT